MFIQVITIGSDNGATIRAWIEVCAIVVSPIITILIWQLNVKERKRLDKIKIIGRFTGLLVKYSSLFHETEKLLIRLQYAKKLVNTEAQKYNYHWDYIKNTNPKITELTKEQLYIKSEITELSNRLAFYMTPKQVAGFKKVIAPWDKIQIRQFEEDFKNIQTDKVLTFSKALGSKIDNEFSSEGLGKLSNEIIAFFKKEFNNKKGTKFQ